MYAYHIYLNTYIYIYIVYIYIIYNIAICRLVWVPKLPIRNTHVSLALIYRKITQYSPHSCVDRSRFGRPDPAVAGTVAVPLWWAKLGRHSKHLAVCLSDCCFKLFKIFQDFSRLHYCFCLWFWKILLTSPHFPPRHWCKTRGCQNDHALWLQSEDIWRHLKTSEDIWRHLKTSEDIWRHLRGRWMMLSDGRDLYDSVSASEMQSCSWHKSMNKCGNIGTHKQFVACWWGFFVYIYIKHI